MRKREPPPTRKVWLAVACLIILGLLVLRGHYVRQTFDLIDNSIIYPCVAYCIPGRTVVEQEAKEEEKISGDVIKELITFYSQQYGVSEGLVTCIIQRESGFDPWAKGDQGASHGLSQFKYSTFQNMCNRAGFVECRDLRMDIATSIKLLCWALSEGLGSHWTAFRYCRWR